MENEKRNKIKNNTSAEKASEKFCKKYGESAILSARPHFSKKVKRKKAKKRKIPSAKKADGKKEE